MLLLYPLDRNLLIEFGELLPPTLSSSSVSCTVASFSTLSNAERFRPHDTRSVIVLYLFRFDVVEGLKSHALQLCAAIVYENTNWFVVDGKTITN